MGAGGGAERAPGEHAGRRAAARGRPARAPGADVLLVSLGTTAGLRAADAELAGSLQRAGASVIVTQARRARRVRTLALTDLAQALAARTAAHAAIGEHRPRAIVYSTVTAALCAPAPGAIRFDALAAGNRPGRHGVWQRPLERRRLARAPLLLPWSERALSESRELRTLAPAIPLPVPVEPSGPPARERDIAAITYAADPAKKGLERVLGAWKRARRAGETLVVAGARDDGARREGVEFAGLMARDEYRALLRRARAFVTAPRREDHGLAQLEALADGCLLVTTQAPGPYAALPIAQRVAPLLVGEDLVRQIRRALDYPPAGHAQRAAAALAPLRRDAVDALVAELVLPALLG